MVGKYTGLSDSYLSVIKVGDDKRIEKKLCHFCFLCKYFESLSFGVL